MEDGLFVDNEGTKFWYKNGLLHKEDGPAHERPDGTKKWYQNGKLHNENGPAVIWEIKFGYKEDAQCDSEEIIVKTKVKYLTSQIVI